MRSLTIKQNRRALPGINLQQSSMSCFTHYGAGHGVLDSTSHGIGHGDTWHDMHHRRLQVHCQKHCFMIVPPWLSVLSLSIPSAYFEGCWRFTCIDHIFLETSICYPDASSKCDICSRLHWLTCIMAQHHEAYGKYKA